MTNRTPQLSITNTRYGNVLHSTILKIFGDELTYNELEPYTRDKDATSYLEMKTEKNNHIGFMFISVFIDKQKIMEKKYDYSNFNCDMFYHLNQLELEEDSCGEKYADCVYGVSFVIKSGEDMMNFYIIYVCVVKTIVIFLRLSPMMRIKKQIVRLVR